MRKIFFHSSKPTFIDTKRVVKEFERLALKAARKNKNIQSIYLFGSYACGNAGAHSDADIMVVLFQDDRRPMDRLDEFILEFSTGPVPADVLVYTVSEINRALKEGNQFLDRAAAGIKLAPARS